MADSQLAVGREVPRHTFANSVKYMIREGSLLRECNDGFQIPLLPCECFLPARGLDLSSVGEHGSQSSARVEDNAACSVLLINKPKASSFEQLSISLLEAQTAYIR
jgi:hypothetical protein